MAVVVEVGSYEVRCGYVGDGIPTQRFYPFHYLTTPPATAESSSSSPDTHSSSSGSLPSHKPSSTVQYSLPQVLSDPHTHSLRPLWSSVESVANRMEDHLQQLDYITRRQLHNSNAELMMVVPEMWHERLDLVQQLCEGVLEGQIATSLYLARPSVCWTLSTGRASGVVMDLGHSHSTCAVVVDSYVLRRSLFHQPTGGRDVAQALQARLAVPLTPHQASFGVLTPERVAALRDLSVVDHAIERGLIDMALRNVKVDPIAGRKQSHSSTASLEPPRTSVTAPDGSEIALKMETGVVGGVPLHKCVDDVYFQQDWNVAAMALKCRSVVDMELRGAQLPHVVGGGIGLMPDMATRLLHELRLLDVAYCKVQQLATSPSVYGAWIGASMAASSSSFGPLWITKAELAEEGLNVLQRKLAY